MIKIFILIFSFLLLNDVNAQTSTEKALDENIINAETYYWLGLSDKGDPKAFKKGLEYLENAHEVLQALQNDTILKEYKYRIELLKTDLKEQLQIAENTFIGNYPLAKFLSYPIFLKGDAFGSYEIAEPHGEVAASRAADKLGKLVDKSLYGEMQLHSFVLSKDNYYPDLESKARVILKRYNRLKVYEQQYLGKFLSNHEINDLYNKSISDTILKKIFEKLSSEVFVITVISKYNEINNIHFYKIVSNIYEKNAGQPTQSIVIYELIRDKRDVLKYYLIILLLIMTIALTAYIVKAKILTGRYPTIENIFLGPFLAFLIGLFTPIIILPVLSAYKPPFEDYIGYTFWWIPLVFIVIILLPMILLRISYSRIAFIKKKSGYLNKQSIIYLCSSLGSASYIIFGQLLYHGENGILFLLGTVMFFGSVGFVNGKYFDTATKVPGWIIISINLLIPVAGAILASSSIFFLIILLIITSFLILPVIRVKKEIKGNEIINYNEDIERPGNIDELIKYTEFTPYQKNANFEQIMLSFNDFLNKKSSVVCLYGNSGVGKTSTAKEIILSLQNQFVVQNKHPLVLTSRCQENSTSQTPFYPIRDLLTEHFNLSPYCDNEEKLNEIDKMLGGLFDNFIPFSSILFPESENEHFSANTKVELFQSILKMLKRMSDQQPVIFYIDDIQWVDQATLELLESLHQSFSIDPEFEILFLYTSQVNENVLKIFDKSQLLELKPLSFQERYKLLTNIFSFDNKTAGIILKWMGEDIRSENNLFWLLKIIEQLARNGHFNLQSGKFVLEEKIIKSDNLPIPEDYKKTIKEELYRIKEHKKIISVAAIIGIEFNINILADSLSIERLECLEILHDLESETSIIYDVVEKDNIFSFSSSFVLHIIKEELELFEAGPINGNIKQIVREYHARVAAALSKNHKETNIYQIANHYYVAGQEYANLSVEYCLKAASFCCNVFQYDESRKFLEMATECSFYIDNKDKFEIDKLVIECSISHLEGGDIRITAEKCKKYLNDLNSLNTEILLIFARTFYDSRQFDACEFIAQHILKTCDNILFIAEAYLYLGLSYPMNNNQLRINTIEKGLSLLNNEIINSNDSQFLLGKIYNTLGEEYLKMAMNEPELKDKAYNYFLMSLEIKKSINDTPGIAKVYGGLGRIELFIKPVNLDNAINYFDNDLKISIDIGDLNGQVQMYSLIGECLIQKGKLNDAKLSYEESLKLAQRIRDKFFAYLGLLNIYDKVSDNTELQDIINEFIRFIQNEKIDLNLLEKLKDFINNSNRFSELKDLFGNILVLNN